MAFALPVVRGRHGVSSRHTAGVTSQAVCPAGHVCPSRCAGAVPRACRGTGECGPPARRRRRRTGLGDRVWMRGAKAVSCSSVRRPSTSFPAVGSSTRCRATGARGGAPGERPLAELGGHRGSPTRRKVGRHAATADEVATAVVDAGRPGDGGRVAGAGHSFTPLVATMGSRSTSTALGGIVAVDAEEQRVRVLAGAPLHALNPALQAVGSPCPTSATSTARRSPAPSRPAPTAPAPARGLAAAVAGSSSCRRRDVVRCSAADRTRGVRRAPASASARSASSPRSTLQCVPAFGLQAEERPRPLADAARRLRRGVDADDHFEFYWFPHTDRVLGQAQQPAAARRGPHRCRGGGPSSTTTCWPTRCSRPRNRLAAACPDVVPGLNRSPLAGSRRGEFADAREGSSARPARVRSSRWSTRSRGPRGGRAPRAPRVVRALPLSRAVPRRGALPRRRRHLALHGHGRETAYIAVHQYHRHARPSRYFTGRRGDLPPRGRPHWGKVHTRGADPLRTSTRASTTSGRSGTAWTRSAASPMPTCATCSATDPGQAAVTIAGDPWATRASSRPRGVRPGRPVPGAAKTGYCSLPGSSWSTGRAVRLGVGPSGAPTASIPTSCHAPLPVAHDSVKVVGSESSSTGPGTAGTRRRSRGPPPERTGSNVVSGPLSTPRRGRRTNRRVGVSPWSRTTGPPPSRRASCARMAIP